MAAREKLIAVVDDHPLIVKALGELLSLRNYKTLDFYSFTSFFEWLEQKCPLDLCIIDYSLPDIPGQEILPSVKARYPDLPVAIWSGLEDENLPGDVIAQGAIGFISKAVSITAIPPAIDLMLAGETFASSRGRCSVIPRSRPAAPAVADQRSAKLEDHPQLTRRELDVMELLLQGLSNKEIATRLSLNPVTVKLHNRSIFRKLKVRNRTEATVRWLQITGDLSLRKAS